MTSKVHVAKLQSNKKERTFSETFRTLEQFLFKINYPLCMCLRCVPVMPVCVGVGVSIDFTVQNFIPGSDIVQYRYDKRSLEIF